MPAGGVIIATMALRNCAPLGVLLILSAMFTACGGTPLKAPGADGAAGGAAGSGAGAAGAGAGGGGGASGGGGAATSPCPVQPPPDDAACTHAGLSCGWGDDPRGDMCRTQAVCVASTAHWRVTMPNTAFCTPLQPVGACPTDTVSAPCTMDATCVQADGSSCRCTNCRPTSPLCSLASPAWYCPQSPTTAGCPPTPPNFGDTCSVEGVECGYFFFECGVPDRVCTHGIWTPGQTLGCPTSSRRVKKDIRYLSDENIDAMATETLRLRLATYEYKSAPYAGRRHLGFIIEDSPNVPAVDRDGDMVDLYGYTSMLLATTQAQQHQIEALKEQVEVLSQQVERMSRPGRHPATSMRR